MASFYGASGAGPGPGAGAANIDQFMQMIMMMSFGNGNGNGNGSQLTNMCRLMGMQTAMSAYSWLRTKGVEFTNAKVIPALSSMVTTRWGSSNKSPSADSIITPVVSETRSYKTTTLNINGVLNAPGPHSDVVYFVCNHVPGITNMHATRTGYFIQELNGFEISPGIFCYVEHTRNTVKDADTQKDVSVVDVCVKLVGRDVDIQVIRDFVSKCKALHEQDGKGLIPDKPYILDIFKFYAWQAHPLETFRTLKNIMLDPDQEHVLTSRLDRFMSDPNTWYKRTGMPRTLGVILHGPPGTGKTSLIKAIAMHTKRHIFNVCLGKVRDRDHLNTIMFNDTINLNAKEIRVPINQRLYVMEDVDADCKVVLSRKLASKSKQGEYEEEPNLTLADILNVFDGTRECPGRIIIMTTNCYDKLDEALLRPGRMDCHIHLGNIGAHALRRMLLEYCDVPAGADADTDVFTQQLIGLEDMLTPAEAACAIQEASCDVKHAVAALRESYEKKKVRMEREEREERERVERHRVELERVERERVETEAKKASERRKYEIELELAKERNVRQRVE